METKFAQRLAANEQPKRERAIKKLRQYIGAKTSKGGGFSSAELLQLWKGLHYCFWMQDKPLLQEELSAKLCGLLKAFPDPDSALAFAAAFFTTQAKEWGRLDRWRMDKFMMLIRDFLHATFQVVRRRQWAEGLIRAVSALIGDVMDAGKDEYPDGLRLHLADIYLEELEKVGAEELNGDQINELLVPFVRYITHSKRDVIVKKIVHRVFGTIIQSVHSGEENGAEDEDAAPKLQFHVQGLQKMLFDAGRGKRVSAKARQKLFRLVKRFSDLKPEETRLETGKKKRKQTDDTDMETPQKKKKKKIIAKETDQAGSSTLADGHTENTHGKDTPESASKHVAFDLERNSSRGLQEFMNSSASRESPYLPSRNPSHGILKESPATSPAATKGAPKRPLSSNGGKHIKKGERSSPKKRHSAPHTEENGAAETKLFLSSSSSKFVSKKKGKVMKKPKCR